MDYRLASHARRLTLTEIAREVIDGHHRYTREERQTLFAGEACGTSCCGEHR